MRQAIRHTRTLISSGRGAAAGTRTLVASTPRLPRSVTCVASFSSSSSAVPASAYAAPPAEGVDLYSMPTDAPAGTYELFYFALRGRAEQIRLLLVESGLPYMDRLLTQWQLRKLKAAGSPISNPNFLSAQLASPLPFGGLPLLKRGDELLLGQTSAILQYIAEKGGLIPSSAEGRAAAQMIVAGAEDLFAVYWPIKLDQNKYLYHSGSFPLTPGTNENYVAAPSVHLKAPYEQYSVPRNFRRGDLPRWLTFFEAILNKNQKRGGVGAGDFFVENKLSYADIVVFAHIQACVGIEKECLQPFPLLTAHYQRIGSREKIAAYLAKRPESGL